MAESGEFDFSVAPGAEIISDSRCFVCGMANAGGLQVRFYRMGDSEARAVCEPGRQFTGYDGLLHGGVSASLLDEIMIKAVLASGRLVVTGRINVHYRRPVPMGRKILLEGRILRQRGRVFETEGLITDGEQTLVRAEGTYVELQGDQRQRLMQSLGAAQEPQDPPQ